VPEAGGNVVKQIPESALVDSEATASMELLTLDELAQKLRLSPNTLYYYVSRHEIPVLRIGKHLRFRLTDVVAYFEAKTAEHRERCVGSFKLVEGDSRSLEIRRTGKRASLRGKE
jgi:excisionase family DNA binding protein